MSPLLVYRSTPSSTSKANQFRHQIPLSTDRAPQRTPPSTMLPPLPLLEDFDVSPTNGFVPTEFPLEILPDPYYHRWEAVVTNLQALVLTRRLREVVKRLPILDTERLQHPAEWRRAYLLLAIMANAYIWGGDTPEEVVVDDTIQRNVQQLIRILESPSTHFYSPPPCLRLPRAPAFGHLLRSLPLELEAHLPRRADRHPRECLYSRYIYWLFGRVVVLPR